MSFETQIFFFFLSTGKFVESLLIVTNRLLIKIWLLNIHLKKFEVFLHADASINYEYSALQNDWHPYVIRVKKDDENTMCVDHGNSPSSKTIFNSWHHVYFFAKPTV